MHIFINIFQTEHFPAVKFAMGYEKNKSFLVIAKSSVNILPIWVLSPPHPYTSDQRPLLHEKL